MGPKSNYKFAARRNKFKLKELSHGILSNFEHRQNYC